MKYNFDKIIIRENTASVKYDLRKEIFEKEDVIPMWVADMDFKTPDFIISAIKERLNHEVFGYSVRPKSYYTSIVNWVNRRHNWEINEDWISFSPGVVPALNMLVLALTEKDDKIVLQPPVYHPFFYAINNNNRQLVENPLVLKNGRYQIDFEDLEQKLRGAKMLLLSNPHNPVGSVWTKDELQKIGEMCLKNKTLVLSDEIHSDLVFKPHQFVPMGSITKEIADNTVSCIAPSKTFNMAALATSSVIISNKELKEKYDQILETIHIGMGNVFGTVASEAAYAHGDEWLNQLMEYLSKNLDFLENYLAKNIPQIKMIRPEGTYLVWLDCSNLNLKGKELTKFMIEEAGLGFNDGRIFGAGGEGFIRMNVACPKQTLLNALNKLEQAVNKL
ncbi:MAG TPA: cystathionine beta-lyase [Bacteroidales bacterium]|nr:cystathionine beta-lyase [Bacteroidales bacterium]